MIAKLILRWTWVLISILLNAVSLINLQKDLIPAAHTWGDFVSHVLGWYSAVRAAIFAPINWLLTALFEVTVPIGLQAYLMVGMVFVASWVLAAKFGGIDKESAKEMLEREYVVGGIVGYPLLLLILWGEGRKNEVDAKIRDVIYTFLALVVIAVALITFADFMLRTAKP